MEMSISLSLHIIYDLLYCISLNVLAVFFLILTLFVHFQCLDQWPTDNIVSQILIPQII